MDYKLIITNDHDLPVDLVLFYSKNPEIVPTVFQNKITIEGDYEAAKKAWAIRSRVSGFKISPSITPFTVRTQDWRGNAAECKNDEYFACDDDTSIYFIMPSNHKIEITYTLTQII